MVRIDQQEKSHIINRLPLLSLSRSFHNSILLDHLTPFVDGPSFLAAGKGDAAVPAAGFLSSSLGPPEGLFGVLEIVRDHGGKAT